ncbi:hypothetical protein WICMUC_000797 [Wickerhamomyces mucosus]|uniref:Copper-fist domain-containing protein n=1 Tax=Wickerhamomyces mucosus TaxID=1378264 RepID=A0A9P8PWW4_9ASCO|nr:hypothetical protein WICMUC_000797 [Wickerhamomyces mucosus]
MFFSDHLKFACDTCVQGHRGASCLHFDRIRLGNVFLIQDRGRPNNDKSKKVKKDDLEGIRIRLRDAKILNDSFKNPVCDFSGLYIFNCTPRCKTCKRSELMNVFLDSSSLILVKHQNGYDEEDGESVFNFLPESAHNMARHGISYLDTVSPQASGAQATVEANKLANDSTGTDVLPVSPYLSNDPSVNPLLGARTGYKNCNHDQNNINPLNELSQSKHALQSSLTKSQNTPHQNDQIQQPPKKRQKLQSPHKNQQENNLIVGPSRLSDGSLLASDGTVVDFRSDGFTTYPFPGNANILGENLEPLNHEAATKNLGLNYKFDSYLEKYLVKSSTKSSGNETQVTEGNDKNHFILLNDVISEDLQQFQQSQHQPEYHQLSQPNYDEQNVYQQSQTCIALDEVNYRNPTDAQKFDQYRAVRLQQFKESQHQEQQQQQKLIYQELISQNDQQSFQSETQNHMNQQISQQAYKSQNNQEQTQTHTKYNGDKIQVSPSNIKKALQDKKKFQRERLNELRQKSPIHKHSFQNQQIHSEIPRFIQQRFVPQNYQPSQFSKPPSDSTPPYFKRQRTQQDNLDLPKKRQKTSKVGPDVPQVKQHKIKTSETNDRNELQPKSDDIYEDELGAFRYNQNEDRFNNMLVNNLLQVLNDEQSVDQTISTSYTEPSDIAKPEHQSIEIEVSNKKEGDNWGNDSSIGGINDVNTLDQHNLNTSNTKKPQDQDQSSETSQADSDESICLPDVAIILPIPQNDSSFSSENYEGWGSLNDDNQYFNFEDNLICNNNTHLEDTFFTN